MASIDVSKYMIGDAKTKHWPSIKNWLISSVGKLRYFQGQHAYGEGWTVRRMDEDDEEGVTTTTYFVEIEDDSLAVMFRLLWS